jgi:hypothetical protein
MSAFLLGIGFRADMGTCARKLVLLKLIDACEEDGTRIFPAISTIARAAQCSTRQVQRELQAFREVGLIRLVREGGKGPRSTNEYALDLDVLQRLGKEGWEAVSNGKGDTVSPLDEAEKGDTGDAERVTPATAKGDSACHPTPPDPSLDPSIEREGADARADDQPEPAPLEDRKKIETAFWRMVRQWPGQKGMPKEAGLRAFAALSPEDREEAERKFPQWLALLKAQRKDHVAAPSTYFGQRLFLEVAEPAEEKPAVVDAPPFGPVWSGLRMEFLVTEPPAEGPKPSAYMAEQLSRDDDSGRQARLARQATHGWPMVNRIHDRAADRKGVSVGVERAERLKGLMEAVPVGSDVYAAWRIWHERMGWPWLPDPGSMRVVYFPAGGPERLSEFEAAVRGAGHDGDRCEAAE